MNTRVDAPDKSFANTLALAIQAECLTYRDYIPWADRMVASLDRPPVWICDLSTTKYRPDALRTIRAFVESEPFEQQRSSTDQILGFLWIRYERKELSWASFLSDAGHEADAGDGGIDCEYFFGFLNELEEAEFSSSVELRQSGEVRQRLADAIRRSQGFYEKIRTGG